MFQLTQVQAALQALGFDGWLMYDFRGSNLLARRVLDFPGDSMGSRRWAYFIPATGEPRKLVHRIESTALDHLPGSKTIYLKWQEFEAGMAGLTAGASRIAMEYSPRNSCPYLSRVDGGTIDLVRANGIDIVESGDLVQMFESVWDDEQWAMHQEAGTHTDSAFAEVWQFIARETRDHGGTTEAAVRDLIMAHFDRHGLTTYHPPIVGVNAHSGDPHYETGTAPIRQGDYVLVDLWAKMNKPRAVYSDMTRVGYVGQTVPEKYEAIFQIVASARDAAIELVEDRFSSGQPLQGYEVDDACRAVIERAGYGEYFVHRTGHSIGQEVHGNGANIDNLETHETRRILPGSCFSIEPGIYLPEFGVRSEVDVFVDRQNRVHVTSGKRQTRIVAIC